MKLHTVAREAQPLALLAALLLLLPCSCIDVDPQDGIDGNSTPTTPEGLTTPLSAAQSAAPTKDEQHVAEVGPSTATSSTLESSRTEGGADAATTPATSAEPSWNRSAVDWLRAGMEAYLNEDWARCARALENAVAEWRHFRLAVVDCRMRCAAEARRAPRLAPDDVDHLHFVEEAVRATLCLMRCKRRAFRGRATDDAALPDGQQKPFRDLRPYEYLQLCYYQNGEYQNAASAVFTILSHDPSNEIMKQNFKYYLSMSEVNEKAIVNYESEKYVSLYLKGTDAYYSEDYDAAVKYLEASLKEFLQAIDECRADCEGSFDQGWLPDFTPSIANHFVYCLKCKAKCHLKLSQLNGDKYEDLLPMHYNYLQFAYYKKGNLKKACAAAASYLMFFPADETMLENVEYYKSLPKVNADMFQPMTDAVYYVKRQTYEEAILRYISHEFVFEDKRENNQQKQSDEIHGQNSKGMFSRKDTGQTYDFNFSAPTKMLTGKDISFHEGDATHFLSKETKEFEAEGNQSQQQALLVSRIKSLTDYPLSNVQVEEMLGGSHRFLVDGLASQEECQHMVQFARTGGVSGDGYDKNQSPHSTREKFEGITLGRAALMVYFGLIDLSTLQDFLMLSERGKSMISAYFNVPKNDLFFSYTHLVCRSTIPGSSYNVSYYSHAIHADNCWLQNDGNCKRSNPAYFWRDYSALLYLNNDFEGGEFIFSSDLAGKEIQSIIKPKCGRLVGFTSGGENLHGVHGVINGFRCALALWFTLDRNQAEWGRSLTEAMVHYLKSGEQPREELLDDLKSLVNFDLQETRRKIQQAKSCDGCGQNEHHSDDA